jgi:pentatricopeptide repeat protein
MLQIGTVPDDETYNLVIGLLIKQNLFDSALKYLDLMLKSGHTLSLTIFTDYVRTCVRSGRLDTLASIIEKCKVFILGIVNILCLSYLVLWHCQFEKYFVTSFVML